MTNQYTILIVDDDPIQLKVVSELLKGMPYRIMMAQNGEKAVEVTARKHPDLIIMDWQMPVMTGIDAIKQIRSFTAISDVPIVLTTGIMVSDTYLQLAFQSGASTYLKKPIGKLELLACIHSMLRLTESQRNIEEKKRALEDLAQQKDHMISVVAHDLKSPLNKLQGMLQLTKLEGSLTAAQQAYVQQMQQLITGGKELIRDLLDIHSFEHHGSSMTVSEIQLPAFVENCIAPFRKALNEKALSLNLELDPQLSVIHSDSEFMQRILANLLSNAIKFSEKEMPIDLAVYRQTPYLCISIRDRGPGISKEDQENIFQKFQKLSTRPTAGETSTGLGLAIVKTLVDHLHGSIEVQSTLGEGTTFIVCIPMNDKKSIALSSH